VTLRARLVTLLGLLASVALLAAACGGSKSSASSAEGASLVRSDALAFVSIDTDFGSAQWKQADTLSQKFPARDQAIQSIEKDLAGQGVDFQNDVKPALGPEFDVAVVGSSFNDATAVGLTKPSDPDKFKALVQKSNSSGSSPSVAKDIGNGWWAVGDSDSQIEQALKGTGSALSDESNYTDALGKLPSDALAKAYVNGAQLSKVIQSYLQSHGSGLADAASSFGSLDFLAASLSVESDGVRLHGAVQGSAASNLGSGDYASKLLDEAPSDAFAFLTFMGGQSLASGLGPLSAPFQAMLGVPLSDVADLFKNENGLYVRPGAVIPEITAILQPDDTSKGLATLDTLLQRIAAATGAKLSGGAEKTLSFGNEFALHVGAVGSKIVITNNGGGVGAVGNSSGGLSDSADFKEAKSAAGMPDSNGGFLYLDLKNMIPLIEGFAGLAGQHLPSNIDANLQPLRSFLTWSAGSGDSRSFDVFLEIK
jgi:hypothetical protein